MGRRRCRSLFPVDKSVTRAMDCAIRMCGSSAHSLLQTVGIEPDDVLLQLCLRLYEQLSRWGLITDLLPDDDSCATSLTHCSDTGCDRHQTGAKSDHLTASKWRSGRSSATSSSSIVLLPDPDESIANSYSSLSSDFSAMNESKDGGVEFKKIRERYVPDADIVCRFEYSTHVHQAGDAIVVKKIGWKMDEIHTSLVSVSAADAELDTPAGKTMRITFPRSLFSGLAVWPDDDLFQFCYMSGSVLQGVSSSFNIIRPKDSDYADDSRDSDVNDDDGFVVLRSPQALLQESMEKLQTDLTAVEAEKKQVEDENKVLAEQLDQLKVEFADVTQEKLAVQQERDALAAEVQTARFREQELEQTLAVTMKAIAADEQRITAALNNEKRQSEVSQRKYREVRQTLQETSDELTRVRAENAELRKAVNDMSRRRREDEQFCQANESMMKVLKDEVQKLEQKTTVSNAERDFAVNSLQAAQKALNQETELREREQAESKALIAELKRTVEQSNGVAKGLKLRLDQAAEEFKEKATKCVKQEGKLQRLREKINQQIRPFPKESSSDPVLLVQETVPKVASAPAAEPKTQESGNESLPCEECGKVVHSMVSHLEKEHDRLVCPVCALSFCKKIPGIGSHFQCHVESHFDHVAAAAAARGIPQSESSARAAEAQASSKSAPLCSNCVNEDDGGEHGQLFCPMCSRPFCRKIPGIDSYFNCHVESHFDPRRYPTDA